MPRVLIADDDEAIRTITAMALAEEGCEVRAAASARAASAVLEDWRPQVVLTDTFNRGVTHMELIAASHGMPGPRAAVVLFTAWPAADLAKQVGADEYLEKPFELEELLAIVNRLGSGV